MNSIKLPQDFAEKVLELESLLDYPHSMDLITDLNELYRIGIDYYVQCSPRKAKHFQKKMTKLLADPDTLDLIESPSPKTPNVQSAQLFTKSNIKNEISKFTTCSNQYVKNILEQSDKALKKSQNLRNVDLNRQQENLQNRIMLKKCRSQQKFMKLIQMTGQGL